MNTVINFENAKLLKEKGFDELTLKWYHRETKNLNTNDLMFSMNKLTENYSAPTIAEVVMWLFEKYEIWSTVFPHSQLEDKYCYDLYKSNNEIDTEHERFNSPTEAYEAGIEYVLKNILM